MTEPTEGGNVRRPVHSLFAAAFAMDLAVAMVAISIQFLGNALEAQPLTLGLLGMASPAVYTLGCLVTGRLSDSVGRRLLNSAACVICAIVWLAMTRVQTALQLLALIPLSGAAISMFWPPMQAWLSEVTVGGRERLNANIGAFNIAWTVGLMIGPPIAGLAWMLGRAAPFMIAAGIVLGLLVLIQTVPTRVEGGGEPAPEDHANSRAAAVTRHFLTLAWIANFASWFGRGLNNVVFPKLGTEMGLPERVIGIVIATYLGGQLLMFLFLRRRSGWQYRIWPLLAALAAGSGGMLLAYFARSTPLYVLAFALAGMGAGVTYVSSLFYSLEGGGAARGARTGIHEAVLGSGVFIGPLAGGAVADYVGLHAPYLFASGLFAAIAFAVYLVWARKSGNAADTLEKDARTIEDRLAETTDDEGADRPAEVS